MSLPSENLKLFQYYNLYRIFIFGLLFISALLSPHFGANVRFPQWYVLLSFVFSLSCIIVAIQLRSRQSFSANDMLVSGLVDMLVIHALLLFSGSVSGGLVNLQFVAIAASNIIVRGRLGYFLAASASLLTLLVSVENLSAEGSIRSLGNAGVIGGVYFAIALIVQNISERISRSEALAKRQQQDIVELEKLNHSIIQSMRTGIVVSNAAGKVLHCNRASLDLLGVNELPLLTGHLKRDLARWLSQESFRAKSFKPAPDKAALQANFMRIDLSHQEQVIIFLEDTRRIAQQAQQLKLASLGRLTASIAHEIRNPLAAISHANQLLLEAGVNDSDSLKFNQIIQRHAQRMNGIVENVLSMSRRKDPDIRLIDLNDWLNLLCEEYIDSNTQNLIVHFASNSQKIEAQFDPSQIEQVMTNLLDNAVRHAYQSQDEPKVSIQADLTTQGQSYIDITDSGPGVPTKNRDMLFEPFFTTESQGTGLGLYLARELCEANQAQLDYIDLNEHGGCFRILFSHVKKGIHISHLTEAESHEQRP